MKTIVVIVAFLFTIILSAQTIESFSIDSGGTTSTTGNIKILYTIGEVNIQEHNAGNITLSEGFINSNIASSTLDIEDENLLDQKISIYPNPATDVINIRSQIPIASVEVFDVVGRKIIATKETTQVKVNHLPFGVYLLKIVSEKGKITKKIIIE